VEKLGRSRPWLAAEYVTSASRKRIRRIPAVIPPAATGEADPQLRPVPQRATQRG